MGTYSKIEWTDHTFNPWLGCTKITPGCDHCYAESWSKRSGLVKWGNSPRRKTSEGYWRQPLLWEKRSAEFRRKYRRRQRIFCASLADVFDNQAEVGWREELFKLIKTCPSLDWLLLTKRPENIKKMLPSDWGSGYANVWLGATAEDQKRFDIRWGKHLSKVSAAVRFISYEPALGPLRLSESEIQPDWIISGGESGAGARLMNPQWTRDLIVDCRAKGVAPFHKQWGSYASNPLVFEQNKTTEIAKRKDSQGKGGGLVDGKIVREFPVPTEVFSSAA